MGKRIIIAVILVLALGKVGLAQSIDPLTDIGCKLYLPTAFTPNDDQINDNYTFSIGEGCQCQELSLQIFDRWGRLVHEHNNPQDQFKWDGTYRGENLSAGVYMVKVRIKLYNSATLETNIIEKKTTVVLVR